MINYYYCKACNKVVARESNLEKIKSFCETSDEYHFLIKVKMEVKNLAQPDVSGSLPRLERGDKIKLYGKKTTVKGFEVYWNDALEPPRYEIILLTTGRGDPFQRSLDMIEVLGNDR